MSLPQQLQQDATQFAQQQGISLKQFVLWAVAEKVGALNIINYEFQSSLEIFQ